MQKSLSRTPFLVAYKVEALEMSNSTVEAFPPQLGQVWNGEENHQ